MHASPLEDVLAFVRVEHSLFALPFILAGFLLGLRAAAIAVAPSAPVLRLFSLVCVAAVAARTAAMTVNRIIDREIDARNPRTANRHLVTGRIGVPFATGLAVLSFAVLFVAAGLLNLLCLVLAPLLVALFVLYPYAKRWTWACHFVLGLAFCAGVMGGFLGVTGTLGSLSAFLPVALLALAAGTWVAGFDIIYALLDVEVDRAQGIRSIPARFGIREGRLAAGALHASTVLLLAGAGLSLRIAWPFFVAVGLVAALLLYEHATVDPTDADAINRAFFRVNAVVGWVALAGFLAAAYA
jgi:4-hydroxybenzoate polyprenyltransferase